MSAITIAFLIAPGVEPGDRPVILAMAVPAVLVGATPFLPIRGVDEHGVLLALTDLALACGLVLVVPAAFTTSMVFVAGLVPMYTFWLGTRTAVGIDVVATAVFIGLGALTATTGWVPAVATFALVVTMLTAATATVCSALRSAMARRRSFLDGIDAAMWESNETGTGRRFVGGRALQKFGISAEDWNSEGFFESRVHPSDLASLQRATDALEPGDVLRLDYRVVDDEGTTRFLEERITVEVGTDGESIRRGVIVEDTTRVMTETAARGFDDFIAEVPMALAVLRLDQPDDPTSLRVVTANPAAVDLLRSQGVDPIGSLLRDLVPDDCGPEEDIWDLPARLSEVVTNGVDMEDRSLRLPGSTAVYSVRAIPLGDRRVGVTLDDTTHTARTAEALRRRAMHDDLTGLPNRAQFNERLEAAIRSCNSTSSPTNVAVLMIDLNKFKEVNDTYGHEYGDKLLIEVARRLTRNIRGCDTIARLGGDEFAVIVLAEDADRAARDIAERIEQVVCQPFDIQGRTITVGTSVGIAVRSADLLSSRTLLRDADHAMYRAKAQGGGIVSHDGRPTVRGTTVQPRPGRSGRV